MCETLKMNTTLITLNLSCEKEREGKERKKMVIDKQMIGNKIGAEGAKALCEMLRVNTSLTSLNLESKVNKKKNEINCQIMNK